MDNAYIYHHLGLGDSIICNGLVRHFAKEHTKLNVFSKSHNVDTLKFMYRDEPNIEIVSIGGDSQVTTYLSTNPFDVLIKAGFENLWSSGKSFDMAFYISTGVDFEERWTGFKVERDTSRENALYDRLNDGVDDYIFVHDDDRYKIDLEKIRKDLRIIKPDISLTTNIFDYCYLIQKAKEVHTIESSFQFIIDSMALNSENYVHRYPRYLSDIEKPVYKTVKTIFQ